ncbi:MULTISPECIES: hypothetical protein [Streptomyces]|uniref:hypothetical protein n=1 Tax=Streptomyces TaxID=1883 RepID=UPI001CECFE03|nr:MULTISPECIES: hypothetical protein [unclassified Streptomyces]MDX6760640.1 hypothetical protein [Streptomyces sp. F8]
MITDETSAALRRRAALNNAGWCDAVCRAHGLSPRYDGRDLWLSTVRTPPLYPDAVTLDAGVAAVSVLPPVDTSSPGCSVKDSFAALDLSGHGFEVLFEAQWIHRPAGAAVPAAAPDAPRWSEVRDAAELAVWEAAWDGEEATGLFRPSLLGGDSAFLAGRVGDRIVAGAVAHTCAGAVGVSNLFARDGVGTDTAWAGTLAAIAARRPDLPVVGYEHGEDLDAALRNGFTAIGPLRVWLHTA